MKILFYNAINPGNTSERTFPPLGIGYLISAVRKFLPEVRITFKIVDQDLEREIRNFDPDLVGISSVSKNYNYAISGARTAKMAGKTVVIGGVHATLAPHTLTQDMDAAVLGEGEITFVNLLRSLIVKGRFKPDSLADIPGIAYWNGGILRQNPPQFVDRLDTLPHPERSAMPPSRHLYVLTSRGCPYNCVFCATRKMWSGTRFFSPEYVIEELEEITKRYRPSIISFYDDLFIADKARVQSIVDHIHRKGLHRKVRFTCSGRANLIDDELCRMLKSINCASIQMGLESGCDKTLRFLKGNSVTVRDNEKAINTCRRHGIMPNAYFIIGSPKETRQDLQTTYDFIRKQRLGLIEMCLLTPLPGTPLWGYAKARGLVRDRDFDWSRLDISFLENKKQTVFLSEVLTRKEVIRTFHKFQRLVLRKNLLALPFHPYRIKVARLALNALVNATHLSFRLPRGGG
jgi:radical SAM superfamily enzyme YgiQ (UPF0313 family)